VGSVKNAKYEKAGGCLTAELGEIRIRRIETDVGKEESHQFPGGDKL